MRLTVGKMNCAKSQLGFNFFPRSIFPLLQSFTGKFELPKNTYLEKNIKCVQCIIITLPDS